jgi:hypothetical protein
MKMAVTRLPIVVAIVVSGVLDVHAHGRLIQSATNTADLVTLTPTLSDSTFCRTDDDVDTWQLSLSLLVRNTGKVPVAHLPGVSVMQVELAPTLEDLAGKDDAKKFVLTLGGVIYAQGSESVRIAQLNRLRVMPVGKSTTFQTKIILPIQRRPSSTAGVAPGFYYMRLIVSPFDGDVGDVSGTPAASILKGSELWQLPTATVPIRLEVPKERRVVGCH